MINFKFHIVKMTMIKSNKIVHLFYEMKSRKLLGYGFDTEPVELHVMLEIMQNYIPPDFDVIGNYTTKFNGKVNYDIVNSYTNQNVYQTIQQSLSLRLFQKSVQCLRKIDTEN